MAKKKTVKTVEEDTFDYDKPRNLIERYLAKAVGESITLPDTDNERILVYLRKLIEVIEDSGGTDVVANPTLAGTEDVLTGLQVGETKYKVENGTEVVANPTLAGTEDALTGLQVGETKYKIESGTVKYLHIISVNFKTVGTLTGKVVLISDLSTQYANPTALRNDTTKTILSVEIHGAIYNSNTDLRFYDDNKAVLDLTNVNPAYIGTYANITWNGSEFVKVVENAAQYILPLFGNYIERNETVQKILT